MRLDALEIRPVRHGNCAEIAEHTVDLAYNNRRPHTLDCVQHPIVVTVYVHTEDAKFAFKTVFGEQSVDVFRSDEGAYRCQVMPPVERLIAQTAEVGVIAVDHQSSP